MSKCKGHKSKKLLDRTQNQTSPRYIYDTCKSVYQIYFQRKQDFMQQKFLIK